MTAPRTFVPRLLRVGGWIVFACLIVLCVVWKGSTRVFTWPWVFYAQVLMLTPMLLAGWVRISSDERSAAGGWALFACGLSIGVSVVLSRNPHFSFEAALYLWSALAFIFWLACIFREKVGDETEFRRLARLAGLALAAPTISSVIEWSISAAPVLAAATTMRGATEVLGHIRNSSPFGHPNYTGGFALLSLPWFASLIRVERGLWRGTWIFAALLAVVLFFTSGSRGALLGAVALVAAYFVLSVASRRIRRRTAALSLLGGVVLVVALGLTNARLRMLLTEPSGMRYPNLGDVQRLGMLQGGWLLGLQRPVVGHGPGMVPFVYPEVRAQVVGGVETSYQLHNAYLQQWVTTGLFGMAGGLALALALIRGTRRWLSRVEGMPRAFALNGASAIVGYAAMAATDYQLDVIGIVAAFSLPTALLLAAPAANALEGPQSTDTKSPVYNLSTFNSQLSTSPNVRWRKTSGVILLLSAVTAAAFLLPHWRARHLHWSAWGIPAGSDAAGTLAKLVEASNAAPWNTHYRNQLGLQLASNKQQLSDRTKRHAARVALAASLARDAAQEPIHANLAWLWLPDDPEKARIEFDRALSLIPDRESLHFGLAVSLLNMGDNAGAVQALALECLVCPAFIASPVWAQPQFAALYQRVKTLLRELINRAATHLETPRWRQRDLIYFTAFVRWWDGGAVPTADELAGNNDLRRAFFCSRPGRAARVVLARALAGTFCVNREYGRRKDHTPY